MWNQQVFTGSTFVNHPEPFLLNFDMSIQDRCIPQILYDESSENHLNYLETSEIIQKSLCMDIISQEILEGNHTTTINVYKLNYDAVIFFLVLLTIIIVIIIHSWKGKRIRTLKPPVPVIYYLAKTAYKQEHADLCMTLIEKENYDVNYTNSDVQLSSFLCSCLSGNANLIAFMIKKGADINSVSCWGDSGLYLAVYGLMSRTSNFKCLDLLLAAGCDINCQNNNGFTALHFASMKGNLLLVQYLLCNGADPTITTSDMTFPYEMALSEGHVETAKYLRNKTKLIE
ncbi:ANK_REP_REGION domain-containing protein [Nephila pilipes]|uniref:Alpha-latrotoxin n=1 Tax=Nephila pilipes TaxID=299642 RepID=A0A8X6P1A2_NEPPI|nr:ANK_REP_REGION domain-containing protein [Nephila pilipes]